ncbi:MAG: type II CRISPR-associated endonuclease Cas1, partial [Bacteroidales bacterium]|nr:type II CRISPR-associated endonuclease Cas1 [Bacteroidales bacterium]
MIKRTLYFGNPAYLSLKNHQLVIQKPKEDFSTTIPIEDIGVIVLDNPQ